MRRPLHHMHGLGQAPPQFGPVNPYTAYLLAAPAGSAIQPQAVDLVGKHETDALMASVGNLSSVAAATSRDLKAALSVAGAINAQKQANLNRLRAQAAQLQAQLVAARTGRPAGLAGVAGRQVRHVSRDRDWPDLGSGASRFVDGQIAKIDASVKGGKWTDLLFNVSLLTPGTGGKTTHDLLTDPILSQMRSTLSSTYNPRDPQLKTIALTALDAMARYPNYFNTPPIPPAPPANSDNATLMASAQQAVFDPDAWGVASGKFSSYVAAHKPGGGGILKSVTKALGQVNGLIYTVPGVGHFAKQLDKYVPGWQVALNFVIPGGSLIGAVGAAAQATSTIPLVGNVVQGALAIAQPITGIAPGGSYISYGASNVTSGVFDFASGAINEATSQAAGFGPVANLKWALTETPLQVANQFPFSCAKVTGIYLSTHGNVLAKLEAASTEAIAQVALVIEVGALAVTGGGAAGFIGPLDVAIASAISASANAVKTTVAAAEMRPPDPLAWAQAGISIAAAVVSIAATASDALAAAQQAFDKSRSAQQAAESAKQTADAAIAANAPNAQNLKAAADAARTTADAAKKAADLAVSNASFVQDMKRLAELVQTAGKTGLSVLKTELMAQQVKKAADSARKQAMLVAAKIDADAAMLEQQIEQIRQQIIAIQRQKTALLARKAARGQTSTSYFQTGPGPSGAIASTSQALGVSDQTTVLLGAAGALLLIGVGVVALRNKNDEDDKS